MKFFGFQTAAAKLGVGYAWLLKHNGSKWLHDCCDNKVDDTVIFAAEDIERLKTHPRVAKRLKSLARKAAAQ